MIDNIEPKMFKTLEKTLFKIDFIRNAYIKYKKEKLIKKNWISKRIYDGVDKRYKRIKEAEIFFDSFSINELIILTPCSAGFGRFLNLIDLKYILDPDLKIPFDRVLESYTNPKTGEVRLALQNDIRWLVEICFIYNVNNINFDAVVGIMMREKLIPTTFSVRSIYRDIPFL